jgi:CRP/FNR family transcriptional regulator, nitrogen oxide reductase regulator
MDQVEALVIEQPENAPIQDILRQVKLFSDLPLTTLNSLATTSHRYKVNRGDWLFHQDDEAHTVYIVLSGRLRLVQHTADGKDVTMATFVPGDVIGLVVALTGAPYPGSAEAIEASELLTLPGTLIWQLLHENADMAVRVIQLIAGHLHEAHNRIRELSAERVQQRVARSLLRLAQKVGVKDKGSSVRLDMRLSRQDLAQMNGTTLETISRTLTAWEHNGIIDTKREQVVIVQPHALMKIADDLPE